MPRLLKNHADHPRTMQRVVAAFASFILNSFGRELGGKVLGAMMTVEGYEGVLAMARLHAEGRFSLWMRTYAKRPGAPVEALAWVIGMVYGPPGQLVIDAHIFRIRAETAPQWGAGLIASALQQLTISADKAGAWIIGGTWRGREEVALNKRYRLGFTVLENTYRHTDGRTYTFFTRPPC